ncbi:hypothetical protein [Paraburkholderia aspalathi]|uniref:hypothetical protein n=1 Tax=Paraburkholderia aspalathi TaxID=1324617 RepID=UPI001BA9B8AB|nr:hypothetical protein [Paraburkholderia aspalathi]
MKIRRHFTESRIAIAISVTSAVFAIAQWKEAKIANSFNEEKISVVIQPNDDPANSIGTPTCPGYGVNIPLTWRVNIFNNSTQPVTIESVTFAGYSTGGMTMLLDTTGGRDTTGRSFPITIAARGFETLVATVPVFAPQTYTAWFQASGLCNNHTLDAKKLALRAGFTETGASSGHPSNAGIALSLKTADGKVVQRQANWASGINSVGPDIKLP